MADISMCEGNGCPLKEKCYRFTAIPNEYRQAYFVEPPYIGDDCDFFCGFSVDNDLKEINKYED